MNLPNKKEEVRLLNPKIGLLGRKVVVCKEKKFYRERIVSYLKHCGLKGDDTSEVLEFKTSAELMDVLIKDANESIVKALPPQIALVIVDFNDTDGRLLLHGMRNSSIPLLTMLPVVAVDSAEGFDEKDRLRWALEMGVNGYLTEVLTTDKVENKLLEVMKTVREGEAVTKVIIKLINFLDDKKHYKEILSNCNMLIKMNAALPWVHYLKGVVIEKLGFEKVEVEALNSYLKAVTSIDDMVKKNINVLPWPFPPALESFIKFSTLRIKQMEEHSKRKTMVDKTFYEIRNYEVLSPMNPAYKFLIAKMLFETGYEDEAEGYFQKAIAIDPNYTDDIEKLYRLNYKSKNFAEILPIEEIKNRFGRFIAKFENLVINKDWDTLLDEAKNIERTAGNNHEIHVAVAQLLLELYGQRDMYKIKTKDAVELFKVAVELLLEVKRLNAEFRGITDCFEKLLYEQAEELRFLDKKTFEQFKRSFSQPLHIKYQAVLTKVEHSMQKG
ncbi:MAG: hypothetical protein L3V56_02230 [Candidatus Magnetoovum sp. WYHC-5]|nr:hypothetical protein [Candidatus Magnetoovum sp. WYHC-5]